MRRGVVFTLDALVAVVIAVIALTILMQMLSLKTSSWSKEISLYNSAQDFLTSRDKNDTLENIFTSTDMNSTMSSLNISMTSQIPASMVARMNITTCYYNQTALAFNCSSTITAQNSTTNVKSVLRRVFTDPTNNRYGIAVMEVWYR
ncbi:hypothetical protein H0N99_01255 [Candidatus Micrarchaeota archaeon]|nr:hypothetical protein [Candidatus Micrarchaeota archaeon]